MKVTAIGVILLLIAIGVCAWIGVTRLNILSPQPPAESDAPIVDEGENPASPEYFKQCHQNLLKIGQAMRAYADDHGGKFPADLGTLLIAEKLDGALFFCPATSDKLPDDWKTMPPADRAHWIDQHSDYLVAPATMQQPDAPLVYDQMENHGGAGMNVLFVDGHVQFMPVIIAHKRFGADFGKANPQSPAPGAADQTK